MALLWVGVLMVVISVIPLSFGSQMARIAERDNRKRLRQSGDHESPGASAAFYRRVYTAGGILFLVAGGVCIAIARLSE